MKWLRALIRRALARDLVPVCRRCGRSPIDHDADAVDAEGKTLCSMYLPGWKRTS